MRCFTLRAFRSDRSPALPLPLLICMEQILFLAAAPRNCQTLHFCATLATMDKLDDAEIARIANLIASARTSHSAWTELRRLKHAFREYEVEQSQKHAKQRLGWSAWPSVTSQTFLDQIRRVRSLHVPTFLRGHTKLMTHQLANRVFMGPGTGYSGILLVHSTGTGKTRTAIEIVEQHASSMRNKACVLGPINVRSQFRNEVASTAKAVFKRGRWELDPEGWAAAPYAAAARRVRDPDKEVLDAQISAMVSARYEFIGWTQFANDWFRQDIHKRVVDFSDRVIVVDEAHNLRPGQSESKNVTKALVQIAQTCFNVKFVLMTATPMFDRAEEIVDLINILRHNDDLPPADASKIFPPSGKIDESRLKDAIRGYVSTYSRLLPDPNVPYTMDVRSASVPGINVKWPKYSRDGNLSRGEAAIMHHIECSELQAKHPALIANGKRVATSLVEGAESSNAVFPGGDTGQAGFKSVLDPRSGQYTKGNEDAFHPEQLHKVSPKAAFIVQQVSSCVGVAMVYTNFVWAGVKLLAAALEERGFRPCEFDTAVTKRAQLRNSGPCYAILSDGSEVSKILAQAKEDKNRDGSKIKVLLCTKVVAEGMDLAFVREVHILDGWWNLSREEQVIGRAVRFGSHARLPAEQRNVTIYRYGVTLPGDREGVDHEMARTATDKHKKIGRVMDILSAESFDCVLHKRDAQQDLANFTMAGVKQVQVTSQGVSVSIQTPSRQILKKRVEAMCDGAVLEVGEVGVASMWETDDVPFREVVAAARDSLGDSVKSGVVYSLADLVSFTGLPDDLGVRSVTEILQRSLPLTPGKHDHAGPELGGNHLIVLSEDEYALAEIVEKRHVLVTLPLVLSNQTDDAESSKDWRTHYARLEGVLNALFQSGAMDQAIIEDMSVDRAICAGASLEDLEASGAQAVESVKRARGLLDIPTSVARIDPEGKGLVFLAKRGATCSHMSRKAVALALESRGVKPPPTSASRVQSCVYAEYSLRQLGLVARPDALGAQNPSAPRSSHSNHQKNKR